ncbi:hypothetical protein [Corallococcus aberystwythensis]|uniref:Lipoprotein n=1 Tax=Corallococcus aberystwythensis TaxID=2316722 RepID=A0A3A8PUH2_9BACT|nr:hypothetical protein [Corallococcus aberystwythensis]RKH57385.1 hypothetical protein D7W81_31405 [Corallococcus aberystwythensis]
MTSHRSVAAGLILGVSGCAGVPQAPPATTATVRFSTQVHLRDCDIVATARPLADAQAVDCGVSRSSEERLKARSCVEAAEAAGKPFIAIFHLPGIDSAISQALIRSATGERFQLWYDSDPGGGNGRYRSYISRKACERFAPDANDEAALRCESQTDAFGTIVCRGTEYSLGPPQSAAGLVCMRDDRYIPGIYFCDRPQESKAPIDADFKPVPPGTSLACIVESESSFHCASSPRMGGILGLRWQQDPPPEASPKGGP